MTDKPARPAMGGRRLADGAKGCRVHGRTAQRHRAESSDKVEGDSFYDATARTSR